MLEHYVIVERIAVGGMGEVFVARQQGVGNFRRTVVLKRLLPDAEGNDEAAGRLLDEARISGSLSHENVVSIIEVGQKHEGQPWLALEYVHGENAGTLRTRAGKRDIAIPVVVAARIVADSARGLQHAHDANDVDGRPLHIIHRDVAPKNIFVRHDGVAKIGDFGIARADARLSHTATGAIAGTLSYMSPEQLIGASAAQALTPASDQFSLGIVLWELLTGKRLFKGEGPVETAEKILQGKIRPPSRHRPEVPAALDAVVLRMLDRDPLQRFADCGEVAHAIEAAVKDAAIAVGRAAVAAFVEEMVGPALRERLRRIEEGAEQTRQAERPGAQTSAVWDEASASRKEGSSPDGSRSGRSASAQSQSPSGTPATAGWPAHAGDATLVAPPEAVVASRPRRLFLAVAVITVVVAVAVAVAVVVGGTRLDDRPAKDADQQATRAYLRDALVQSPIILREAVVTDAVAGGVDEARAEALATALVDLQRRRLTLVAAHHEKSSEQRAGERAAVFAEERLLIEQARAALRAHGVDDTRGALSGELMAMWMWDSSAPLRWLPRPTLEQMQVDLARGGVDYMKKTSDERWQQVDRLVKRGQGDPARVRAAIGSLITAREALIERFSTAPLGELAGIEQEMKDIARAGEAELGKHLAADFAHAVAGTAFIELPDSQQGEPYIDDGRGADH